FSDSVAFCAHDGTALRSREGLEPGTVIRKKYQIISELGRGGMAVVYRVRHLIWNEDKALKIMLNTGEGGLQIKAFLSEAMVMRQFKHDHIVAVEDADYTEDDRPFVVMEYVEGESLRQRIKRVGVIEPDLALTLTAQVCSALEAAHQRGIIHRDIKPQNLLLAGAPGGREALEGRRLSHGQGPRGCRPRFHRNVDCHHGIFRRHARVCVAGAGFGRARQRTRWTN